MEGVNSTKTVMIESNLFQIPIEEYEKSMDAGKKKEILNLLKNSNNLHSRREFIEINSDLHCACKEGDIELIQILLCETIEDSSNDFVYKIDKTNKTASLFKIKNDIDHLIIPRNVTHESTEYLITSITGIGIHTKSIEFVENSEVKTIYGYIFNILGIEELHLPASLNELKEGWSHGTSKLTKISIPHLNDKFIFKEDKFLLGKMNPESDEFNIFLFARRDIEEISIPSNIKVISSNAFGECRNLRKVEIPIKSNLQKIESFAFMYSNIEELHFPASLNELEEGWCRATKKLKKISISHMNDNFIFKDEKILLGKMNPKSDEFDILHFARRDIEELSIQSNIKIISSNAFELCENLRKVEIPLNSNLQKIGKNSFLSTNIEEIFIPSKVTKISKNAFFDCHKLKKVEIPMNSNLQKIGENSFSSTNIEEIFIPSNVTKICKNAFYSCESLKKVEIQMNSNLKIIEENAFSFSKIERIFIPKKVTKIGANAFCHCHELKVVEIQTGSNLQIIGQGAFTYSKIERILIPSKITQINKRAFFNCRNLQIIEIPEKSKLQTLILSDFYGCQKLIIMIPTSLRKVAYLLSI
ncbi:hypothetical protein M9Y10_043617 [Tritrichomonas musculus]|uniref:Uncharacterized protein n=1 Tax=Tritrichomonas musculus TaxID=1915356 RepID=A0ABR2K059_9EUKA